MLFISGLAGGVREGGLSFHFHFLPLPTAEFPRCFPPTTLKFFGGSVVREHHLLKRRSFVTAPLRFYCEGKGFLSLSG